MFGMVLAQQNEVAAAVLFYVFAALAAGSSVGVVLSRNIVRMATCLLFTLGAVAALYFLLAAEFLAAVQLVVYAGGTLILIVFGIMLTSKSPFVRLEPRRGEVMAAVVIGAILLAALVAGILAAVNQGLFSGTPIAHDESYPVDRLGQVLLGDFLVPFEIVSVLLLVVMIGAAYLAKARKRS